MLDRSDDARSSFYRLFILVLFVSFVFFVSFVVAFKSLRDILPNTPRVGRSR